MTFVAGRAATIEWVIAVASRTLSLVIADDSMLVREGMRRILGDREDIEIVAECGDLMSTIAAVERSLPDVVLTDIRMPPTNTNEGIIVARRLQESHPEVGVVVVSQVVSPSYALALFAGGAARRGYLLKERLRDARELVGPLRAVAAGGSYVDPAVVDALLARAESGLDALTPAERAVLAPVARGLSNAAIARELGVNVRAVERQIGTIFAKLGLPDDRSLNRRVAATLAYLSGRED